MSFSKLLFRLLFVVFVIIYVSVLAEFINPNFYNVNLNVEVEAIVLTSIVALAVYVCFFLRKGVR